MLDNEEKLLKVIKSYFSIKEISIITTNQLEIALLSLENILPDCIVIDIAMPNNIGFKFIQELQENKQYYHIPFILLTTKGLTEDRIKGYNLGCSAYISKPFDPEELEAIIKNLVLRTNNFYEFILETYTQIKSIRLHLSKKYNYPLNDFPSIHLTQQEQFILRELLIGRKTSEIAFSLQVSIRFVEKYISRILNKTKSKNINELQISACLLS
jgi:DNA-binding NarL/FixJ family response regulator